MKTEQELIAQQQIIATTIVMARLTDSQKWDALPAVFTDEVSADYTALIGGEPVTMIRATDLIAGWKEGLSPFTATQHLVTNHEVVITGDTAEVRAYFQATHCKPDHTLWVVGGRYQYSFQKVADEWRISAIILIPIWTRDDSK
jgi:3-phenylpropionate/cinnamic acid dioxygenase small subunit